MGEGASKWAHVNGILSVDPLTMVSARSLSKWKLYRRRCGLQIGDANRDDRDEVNHSDNDLFEDTVGAICIDVDGNVASGVSSGGVALKIPGRLGEAAHVGSGCWARQIESHLLPNLNVPIAVACSTSGTGEQIMRANLAQTICNVSANFEPLEKLMSDLLSSSHGSILHQQLLNSKTTHSWASMSRKILDSLCCESLAIN